MSELNGRRCRVGEYMMMGNVERKGHCCEINKRSGCV